MDANRKSEEQLLQQLEDLRQRNAELEKKEIECKRMEETLRESIDRFHHMTEQLADVLYQTDTHGIISYLSPSARVVFGWTPAEMTGRSFVEFLAEEEIPKALSAFQAALISGQPNKNLGLTMKRKDGSVFSGEINGTVLRKDSGVVGTLGLIRDISDRKRTEEALRESEENYRNLFENAAEAIYLAQDGKIVFHNPRVAVMTGYSSEELMSRPFVEFIHPEDRNMVVDRHIRRMRGEEIPHLYDFRIIHKDGTVRWVELNVVLINWKGKKAALNFLSDISDRKQVEEKLQNSEALWRLSIDNMLEAYVLHEAIIDENGRMVDYRFLELNPAAQKILNIAREDIVGKTSTQLYPHIVELGLMNRYADVMATGVPAVIDDFYYAGDSLDKVFDISCFRIDNHHFVCVFRDITDRKKAEEALTTLSLKDDLTGLYNRRGFFALAEQGLKSAQRMGTELFLIFGDLDNLKRINDTFGHKEGDQALMDISQILKETFRESDIIARVGGDEFVILAMNNVETSAEKLIDRFEKVLTAHHLQTKHSYKLSMSFGSACFDPQNPCSIDVLVAQADKLMYENKQKG